MQSTLVTIETKMNSGKCLTLRNTEDLVLYDKKPHKSQVFEIVKTDLGQVYFKCQESNNAITLK